MNYKFSVPLERATILMKQARWKEAFTILQLNYVQHRTETNFIKRYLWCCIRLQKWHLGIEIILNDVQSNQVLINPGNFLQTFLSKGSNQLTWDEISEIEILVPTIEAIEKNDSFRQFMKAYTSMRDNQRIQSRLIEFRMQDILIDCTQLFTGTGFSGIPRTIQSILHKNDRIQPVFFDSAMNTWVLMDYLPTHSNSFFPKIWGYFLERSRFNERTLLVPYSRADSDHLSELTMIASGCRSQVIPIYHDGIPILHPELESVSHSDRPYLDFYHLLDRVKSIFFVSKKANDDYLAVQRSRGSESCYDQSFYIVGNASVLSDALSNFSLDDFGGDTHDNFSSNLDEDEFKILFIGALTSKRKNLPTLLRAIANLKIKKAIVVNLVSPWGPRQSFDEFKAKIFEDMNLSEVEVQMISTKVRFCHYHKPNDEVLLDLYMNVDLVCIPSRCEGFGLPFLEACAAGKEILVSSGGVARDVADSFQFTNLLDPCDHIKWRDEIVKVLERKERGIQDSNIAIRQEIAKKLYSVQTFQEKLFHSIETVISSNE